MVLATMPQMDIPSIAALPLAERLRAMELIWETLRRDDAAEISPHWHGEVLRQRLADSKPEDFVALEDVEAALRKELGYD